MTPAPHKVTILGGGVSGLVVGWMLSKNGWDVTILEKEDAYGGLAATRKWDEFDLDFGPHIFHTVNKDLEALWEKEFGDLFVKGEFWCKNVKGARFDEHYDYPLSHESFESYPAELRAKIRAELKEIDPATRSASTNYRDYIRALVGPTLQGLFFENYPTKLWGLTTAEMTANWAPKRIELREKRTPFYTGRWNAVGRRGSGCVLDRIADQIRAHGGRILLNHGVSEIVEEGDFIKEIRLQNGAAIPVGPKEVVVSTVPVNVLARMFKISCPLSFRGVVSVALAFRRPHVLPEGIHFLYYDAPEISFHRVSEQKKFSSEGFPKDRTFVTAEIAYTIGDAWDKTAPGELIERVLGDLVKVGLVDRRDYEKGLVQKKPYVYPLLTRDYEHQVRDVFSRLSRNKSLYIVGGPAEYNYADIHINFLKAMDLANILMDKFSDFYKVRRDRVQTARRRNVPLGAGKVGEGQRPFVIAEAGLNHNGDVTLAMRLVEEAKKAGCDAVKFQTYASASRVSNKIKKANYAEQITGLEENLFEMFRRLELSREDHARLFEHGRKTGIPVFSTPFDLESVELLESLGAPYYKVASSDLNHLQLLRRIARTGKPVILSTGMSTLGEIEESVHAVLEEGNDQIVLLHCLSSYPANPEELNLNVIGTLSRTFQVPVGFSDHTPGLSASVAALALGACVIERHFTLDRSLEGPDHVFSSEPGEMAELTRLAHRFERMLGDGIKRIQPSEYDTINSFKKTIYARQPIRRGTRITEDMLAIKGPAGGLSPKYWPVVVGRTAQRDIDADHPLAWDDV
jgi:sialic acid synthase SpsE/protoporphyrinogen oxidase